MARVTAMVVMLDNGKYRKVKLGKVKSIYTAEKHMCAGHIDPGEDDVAGPETDKPDFSPDQLTATTRSLGNGDDPVCYLVNGVIICT